jgi:molybdate/tungstate transport system permease protein
MKNSFKIYFTIASLMLVGFIVFPLLTAIFSISPSSLINSFQDPELLGSLTLTFYASLLATLLSLVTGIPLAYMLARHNIPGKKILESIVDLPVVIPHTAAGVALLLFLGRNSLIGRLLSPMGVSFTDNLLGIMAAMAFVSVPYLISYSRNAFASVDVEMEQAAKVDGASSWDVFWRISIPQSWRGISSGILMMWARGISEFGAVVILAYHPKILPVLVFERFQGFGLEAAQSAAVILILVVLVVFIVLRVLLNRQPF